MKKLSILLLFLPFFLSEVSAQKVFAVDADWSKSL